MARALHMGGRYIMTKDEADKVKEPLPEPKGSGASSSSDQPPKNSEPPLPKQPLLAIEGPKYPKTGKAYAAALARLSGGTRLQDGTVQTSYCSTVPPSVPPMAKSPSTPPMAKTPTTPPTDMQKAPSKAAVTPALFTNVCMYASVENDLRQYNRNILEP